LKGADICALEPERAARALVDGGFTPRYDYALQTMKEVPYNKWRVYDPEDSVRFYALRLREAGMIKSTPQRLIAQGTGLAVPQRAEDGAEGMISTNESPGTEFSRRELLAGTSMLGAATLLGLPRTAAAEPPPEIQKIRLVHNPAICLAPQYLAEELLRLEGFSEVEYVDIPTTKGVSLLEAGRADITMGALAGCGCCARHEPGRSPACGHPCRMLRAIRQWTYRRDQGSQKTRE
jgi:hypothetical protein